MLFMTKLNKILDFDLIGRDSKLSHNHKSPSKSQTTPCTYGANPPVNGKDFINLNNFDQYQIDGKECNTTVPTYNFTLIYREILR